MIVDEDPAGAIADVARVRALLILLGHRFTRPKMRALCRTLDAVDAAAEAAGEPELAVLVVREADGLPGQGWWASGHARRHGYDGPWSGPEATAFVQALQACAFAHWATGGDSGRARRPNENAASQRTRRRKIARRRDQ